MSVTKDRKKAKPGATGSPSVFISHSSRDREKANLLCERLETQGVSCWIAPRNVSPGEPYGAQIVRALEDSDATVFVLSENSNTSRHVESEVARAFEKGKAIFPVRLAEIWPSKELELFITSPHWIEAWQWGVEKAATELAEALRAGSTPRTGSRPTPPSKHAPAPRRLPKVIGCLTALLLLAVAGLCALLICYPERAAPLRERIVSLIPALSNMLPREEDTTSPEHVGRIPWPSLDTEPTPAAVAPPAPANRPPAGRPPSTEATRMALKSMFTVSPKMEFVWILDAAIWAGKCEVTNRDFKEFREDHWSGRYRGEALDNDDQPAVKVSHADAVAFANWLSKREDAAGNLPTGWTYRLPTAAEWLAIAQCGDGRVYPWGSAWPPTSGNYADAALSKQPWAWSYIRDYKDGCGLTCTVGESGGNEWQLCGVGGNVWEWTSESKGNQRAVRGGAWDSYTPQSLQCAVRAFFPTDTRNTTVSFRLVLALEHE